MSAKGTEAESDIRVSRSRCVTCAVHVHDSQSIERRAGVVVIASTRVYIRAAV